MLGQQAVKTDLCYRLLKFCRIVKYEDKYLLYNNLTKEMIELTEDEISLTKQQSYTENEKTKYLIRNWFLVPINNDDCKLKNQLESLSKLLNKKDYIDRYIILTTTDCNARCFYCYESGIKKFAMDDVTAKKVADFIKHHSKDRFVKLTWFGGEPLYNYKVIDIICDELTKNGINYVSKMTTNGYLFDEELVDKAVALWNLKRVQITLDGTEQVYNRYKNYIYKADISPYLKVLDNIKLLSKEGVFVNLRVNIGIHNYSNICDLVNELHEKFKGYNNVKIYVSILNDSNGKFNVKNNYPVLMEKLFELEDHIDSLGMLSVSNLSNNIMTNCCFADDDAAIGIMPNGKLMKCEHIVEGDCVGDIFSGNINRQLCDKWKERVEPIDLCSSCACYPTCITLKKCIPVNAMVCNLLEKKRALRMLDKKIIKTYKNLINVSQESIKNDF